MQSAVEQSSCASVDLRTWSSTNLPSCTCPSGAPECKWSPEYNDNYCYRALTQSYFLCAENVGFCTDSAQMPPPSRQDTAVRALVGVLLQQPVLTEEEESTHPQLVLMEEKEESVAKCDSQSDLGHMW